MSLIRNNLGKRESWGAVMLVLAFVLLLPWGRMSELPLSLMAIGGLVVMLRHPAVLWREPATRLLLAIFACWWLPMLLSAPDAVDAPKAWLNVFATPRIALAGVFVIAFIGRDLAQHRRLLLLVAPLIAFWATDALVQASWGANLLGMERPADRVNGVFGQHNLKLGPLLALFSPLLLIFLARLGRPWMVAAGYLLILAALLVIGTRAAWIMFFLITLLGLHTLARRHRKQALWAAGGVAILLVVAPLTLYFTSPHFQDRIQRSLQVLEGSPEAVDYAFSTRLPIWNTALEVIGHHPINGVGVRGFRVVYPTYADLDDPWLREASNGAFHTHQLLLEVAAETGFFGLLGLLIAAWLAIAAWRDADPARRDLAWPFALGLAAALFPLNTHYALYSTFWSTTLWWGLLLYIAAITPAPAVLPDESEARP